MSTNAIKAVIFDLDGTLYRMKWFMKPLITIRLFPHCLRLPRYLSVRDTFAGKDMGSAEALLEALAGELSRRNRGSTPAQMRTWIYDGFYRQFENVMPLMRGRRDGLGETLSRLRTRGIKVGVLSDYARVEERLARLAIDPALFDSLASAESAGALKPAPRPFLEMCGAWAVHPGETLVVGDRFDTDGAAAKSAGMQFLKIGDKKGPLGEGRSWTAIKSYLNEL